MNEETVQEIIELEDLVIYSESSYYPNQLYASWLKTEQRVGLSSCNELDFVTDMRKENVGVLQPIKCFL